MQLSEIIQCRICNQVDRKVNLFSFDLALTTHLRIVFLNSMYFKKLEPEVLFRLLCGQGGSGLDGT